MLVLVQHFRKCGSCTKCPQWLLPPPPTPGCCFFCRGSTLNWQPERLERGDTSAFAEMQEDQVMEVGERSRCNNVSNRNTRRETEPRVNPRCRTRRPWWTFFSACHPSCSLCLSRFTNNNQNQRATSSRSPLRRGNTDGMNFLMCRAVLHIRSSGPDCHVRTFSVPTVTKAHQTLRANRVFTELVWLYSKKHKERGELQSNPNLSIVSIQFSSKTIFSFSFLGAACCRWLDALQTVHKKRATKDETALWI